MAKIISEKIGSLQVLTLNRPEALNALDVEMVEELLKILEEAKNDSSIVHLLFKGQGEKAFCAGGDIKAARQGAIALKEGRISLDDVAIFFKTEYSLNQKIFHFPKPIFSFMNGITMGGGVGIAGACKYRIATEKTVLAMPEVSIGFFPDVGAAYYLSRAPQNAGIYLGLTGAHISNPADLIKCGFATHYMASDQIGSLLASISKNQFLPLYNKNSLTLPYDLIEQCFGGESVSDVIMSLEEEGSDWSLQTAKQIKTKSPTSLTFALHHIKSAHDLSFDDVMNRDLRLAKYFMQQDDFIEGVRAMVVDKDKSPQWNPAKLEDVEIDKMRDFFN